MIIRQAKPQTLSKSDAPKVGPDHSRRISEIGGLTQFGAYIETLLPGSRSSDRHWHEHEDELLFLLSGEATIIEDDGEHIIGPGDAACWPAGLANAHTVLNHTNAPCTYLICGTRLPRVIVHYPDSGRTLFIEGENWRIQGTDGTLIHEGQERSLGDWLLRFHSMPQQPIK